MFLIACTKVLIISIFSLYLSLLGEVEKSIVYKPSPELFPLTLNAEINEFKNSENLNLSYLKVKGDIETPVILFCHGNEGNFTWKKLQNKLKFFEEKGYKVYIPDYRGYGTSEGRPDEQGIYSDVRAFVDYLGSQGIKPENIVIWGHSLGAAIVIDVARDYPFKGVIAEAGFTSVEDMRDYRIKNDDKGNPVSNFVRDSIYKALIISQKFESKEKISSIKSPILVVHGKKDKVVPFEMGEELVKLNNNAVLYSSEVGEHNTFGWQDEFILKFIQKL